MKDKGVKRKQRGIITTEMVKRNMGNENQKILVNNKVNDIELNNEQTEPRKNKDKHK